MANLRAAAIGRMVPVKAFDVLLKAWQDIPITLTIGGDGRLLQELRIQSQELDVNDRVDFPGWVDGTELIRSVDIVVMPSHREGFSYVILEALQLEKIVVSTNTGFAPDILPQDYLVDPGDPKSIAQKVNAICADIEKAQSDFIGSWKLARSLTIEKMAREIEDVYYSLVSPNQ